MDNIRVLRQRVHDFSRQVVIPRARGMVLEVGCDYPGGSPYPDLYVDIKEGISKNENCSGYFSLDNRASVQADFTCDILEAEPIVGTGSVDTVIILEVIEHMWGFWKLPDVLNNIMNDEGILFLSTPFNFLIHDPKPDYWRITEEGLKKLFSPYFHVTIDAYPNRVHPIHYTMVGVKKDV